MTSSLWRTQRPRFPQYIPDGFGRDYYIKFDNGGYWATQFSLRKKPDYERPLYSNFHTLFHQAAPFKYWGNGHGRETYILQTNGLFHDQKPLCAYKLTDFLRDGTAGFKYDSFKRKLFMSVSEKKYNNKLRCLEKRLIKRLYTEPMNLKKSLRKKNLEINFEDSYNNTSGNYDMKKSNSYSENKGMKKFMPINTDFPKDNEEEKKNCVKDNMITEYNNKNRYINEKEFNKGFNTICNFHNKFRKKKNNLFIKTNDDNNGKFNLIDDRSFNKYFDYNRTYTGFNNHKTQFKFTDPKMTNSHRMKVAFNFRQKPKGNKIKIKNIKLE